MANPNSIDELFLKALDLSGSKRRAFLRTLPAETRVEVFKLLAADESVAKRAFLTGQLHDDGPKQLSLSPDDEKAANRSPRRPRQRVAETPTTSRKMQGKKGAVSRGGRGQSQPSSRLKKTQQRQNKSETSSKGYWLSGVAGIVICLILAGGILSALKQPTPNKPEPTDFQHLTPTTASSIEVVVETLGGSTVASASATSTAEVTGEKLLFTPAISAPPLNAQELEVLPKAVTPSALVTNPQPLPGVRSWTLETMGYRNAVQPSISCDGRFVAIGGRDGNIRIVNLKTGSFERLIIMPTAIGQIRWLPGDRHLLCSNGYHIFQLNVASGQTERKLPRIRGNWSLTGDGKQIMAIQEGKKTLSVFSAIDFSVVEELEYEGDHRSISLSAVNRFIATYRGDTVHVYQNSRPLKKLKEIKRPARMINCAWSGAGRLATGWTDGRVVVHDINQPDDEPLADVLIYTKGYTHACCWDWLSEDIVLMTGTNEAVSHFSVLKKTIVAKYPNKRWGAPLQYRRDLRLGVICGGEARLLLNGKPERHLLPGDVRLAGGLTFSSDGAQILMTGFHSTRYSLQTGQSASLLTEISGGPRYSHCRISSDGRMLCVLEKRVDIFLSNPPTQSAMSGFDLVDRMITRAVWAEDDSSVLACTSDGNVMRFRIGDSNPSQLKVASGESLSDAVWDHVNRVAVLMGTNHLFEWSPDENSVQMVRELPAGCNRRLELNPAGTHLVVSGRKLAVLSTGDYTTVHELDWMHADPRWLSADELVAVTDRGATLRKIKLSAPAQETSIPVPLAGYAGRESLTFSHTAPVGAAILQGNQVRFFDVRNGAHLGTMIPYGAADYAFLTPAGRIVSASRGFQDQVVYQILTDDGQETLTPAAFFARFGKYFSK